MPGLHGAQMVVTFNKLYPANSGITGFEICLLYFTGLKKQDSQYVTCFSAISIAGIKL